MPGPTLLAAGLSILVLLSLGIVLATCMTSPLVPTQANLQLTFSQTGVDGTLSVTGAAFGSAVPAGSTSLLVYSVPCADVSAGLASPESPALVSSGPTSAGTAVTFQETSLDWSVVAGGSRPLLLGTAVQLLVDGVTAPEACCEVTAS
ncbi:hypothetical protein FJT64_018722 [Amphibalanus amphitrite]|uniref:Uncharacterized protein n=1 Tax=Amphibalanus amphitrite TaxID=1232801 RepID=A0A6A4X2J6_AMPAM|nr:hypothetical protein FJT64_018722 [Amphibalanus amphitrite]